MAALLVALASSCSEARAITQPVEPSLDPTQRAVYIETTGCGLASGRTGSGVAVGDGLVLTVAHLVAQADEVFVSLGEAETNATVTAIDFNLDLALLSVAPNGVPIVETASIASGAAGTILGGENKEIVPFEVEQVVNLSIERVLGSDRHSRRGYALTAATSTGDSGAGAYDDAGRLIGIVFATGSDGETTWVTSSAEVDAFLDVHVADTAAIRCNPAVSLLDLP